jgi:hypothetical protein
MAVGPYSHILFPFYVLTRHVFSPCVRCAVCAYHRRDRVSVLRYRANFAFNMWSCLQYVVLGLNAFFAGWISIVSGRYPLHVCALARTFRHFILLALSSGPRMGLFCTRKPVESLRSRLRSMQLQLVGLGDHPGGIISNGHGWRS